MRQKLKVLCVFDLIERPSGPDLASELQTEDWKTERHVLEALATLGHETSIVGVLDDVTPLIEKIKSCSPDVAFNLTEHFGGDRSLDKSIAALLDLLGVPYTGAGPLGLALARDKALSKKILTYHRVRTPAFIEFERGKRIKIPKHVPYPVIVKPVGEDASEGISRASLVGRDRDLAERVRIVHESVERNAIAEQYIEGQEIFCSILGNDRLRVLPLRTMWYGTKRGRPKFLTFRLKWDMDYQQRWGLEFGFAVDLPEEIYKRIGQISKRTYRALVLQDYGRIDIRVTSDGRIYVIEANPNPFLARREDFADSALEAGIEYEAMIDRILSLALKRAGK